MDHLRHLATSIPAWGEALGFQQVGITDTDLGDHEGRLQSWLGDGFAGSMDYMSRHGHKRSRPAELVPGTVRVITVRMDYLVGGDPGKPVDLIATAGGPEDPATARISRYALGRDYHKVLRGRLKRLLARIEAYVEEHNIDYAGSRLFTDSAPVLEKALAEKSGLGWIGKNTLLLNEKAGSWFFLGEIFTSLPLPTTGPAATNRCGSCTACLDVCPTGAFTAPYRLDARRCIAYLTIENRGAIPRDLRRPMGNRVFGCDDCQEVCPWNRYARYSAEQDFHPRHGLDAADLLALFAWSDAEFLEKTAGSALRRTGYEGWQRNLAIGLGNARHDHRITAALAARRGDASPMVREHIDWALAEQREKTHK